ncbi:MAG TPA: hypothetical protein PK504_05100 [Ferruginibacter sp.]|nr:hypothetical protein [Ferruginibacter sp.]HRE64740.1 hypothetical protein [Ferruginibacter sp.]
MSKILLCSSAAILLSFNVFAQLKVTDACPVFNVDVLDGHVNRIHSRSTISEVIKTFPCQTSVEERIDSIGRCTGVFYANKHISFYTGRNYIEISQGYTGKMEPAIMGSARGSLFNTLGLAKIKDIQWDAFQTKYGTLILYYNKSGKVEKIQMSSRTTDAIKLCE